MPQDTDNPELILGSNPMLAIGLSIGVATIMVTATTISFLRSGAYDTVKQIQTGSKLVQSIDKDGLDALTPIKSSDIDTYEADIYRRIRSLDDYESFGPEDVSDASLGL